MTDEEQGQSTADREQLIANWRQRERRARGEGFVSGIIAPGLGAIAFFGVFEAKAAWLRGEHFDAIVVGALAIAFGYGAWRIYRRCFPGRID